MRMKPNRKGRIAYARGYEAALKGKRGERELACLLSAAGFPAIRGVQYHGGSNSPDVRCPCLPGVHWEVKRTERLRLYEAAAQAKHDAGDKLPIVAHRANNADWLAILPVRDLLAILRASDYVKRRGNNP